MIEDLAGRLAESTGDDQATLLASIYLVLPDVPEEEPDWLEPLSRVSVAPRQRDVEYLLDTLEQAIPATLRRSGQAQHAVSVRVDPNDEAAIPIAPHLLRRQLNEIADLWHADIATANGRLAQGALDLPPLDAVLDVFAIGLETAGVVGEGERLSAHQAWPHVAAGFDFGGTPGPYWFLVRRCSDFGQLEARIREAAGCQPRLEERMQEALVGIGSLRSNRPIDRACAPIDELVGQLDHAQGNRVALKQRSSQNRCTRKALPEELEELLENVAEGGEPVGALLDALFAEEREAECMTYWPRVLAEAASEADDVPGLVRVLKEEQARAAHTAARKALRRIDFAVFGPALQDLEETAESA